MAVWDPRQLWEATLGELQLQVARPSFQTFLQGTVALSIEGDCLLVGTANTFGAEYLGQRLHALIQKTVQRLAGTSLDVRFQAGVIPAAPQHTQFGPTTPTVTSVGATPASPVASGGLHPDYRFETFIVGPPNALSHAAAQAAAELPGQKYNPVFIYSAAGLGKTHLLQAIARRLREKGLNPLYQTSEQFTNSFIRSIRHGQMEEFRQGYRAVDALLIDDIQFLCGKEQTLEGFFHLFNELHQAGKQLVISSDRPPATLEPLATRLRSRFEAGLTTDIQPPSLEMRTAILRAKADRSSIKVPDGVLESIAQRATSSIRALEGLLNRVCAWAEMTGGSISKEQADHALEGIVWDTQDEPPSETEVLNAVSQYYGLPPAKLKGRDRDRKTAYARRVCMYLLKKEGSASLTEIARLLGGRDPSSAHQGYNSIEEQQTTNLLLQRDLLEIQRRLKAPPLKMESMATLPL